MATRASHQRDLATRLDPHQPRLAARTATRLHETRDSDAHELATCAGSRALFGQLRVSRQLERARQRPGIVTRVVFGPQRVPIRKLVSRDEVLAPQLDRIHPQIARDRVDATLDRHHCFGSPGASVRACRRRVGEHRQALDSHVGNAIAARSHIEDEGGRNRGGGVQVGAHVGDVAHLEAGQRPVTLSGELDVDHHVASLGGDLHILAARRHPLDWPTVLQREGARQQVLRTGAALGAKATAHVGSHHAQLLLVDADRARQISARAVWRLRRHPRGQLAVIGHDDDAARLHRHRRHPRVVDAQPHDGVCFGEGAFDVAALALQPIAHVVFELRVYARRIRLQCRFGGRDGWQRLVLDLDQIGGVARH